ncbi:MAG: hypothetical protein ACI4MH_07765 [Candidatus Coproplasma sp.]
MKDFKNYNGENNCTDNARTDGSDGGTRAKDTRDKGADKTYENTVNLAATLAKAFNGKSEGQILQTIIAQAEQGKREGTLTNADLDNFYATLSPLLDGFKRKKLQQIISKLKSI